VGPCLRRPVDSGGGRAGFSPLPRRALVLKKSDGNALTLRGPAHTCQGSIRPACSESRRRQPCKRVTSCVEMRPVAPRWTAAATHARSACLIWSSSASRGSSRSNVRGSRSSPPQASHAALAVRTARDRAPAEQARPTVSSMGATQARSCSRSCATRVKILRDGRERSQVGWSGT
jgi:hypothetical protein